jgi:hypothetical protein
MTRPHHVNMYTELLYCTCSHFTFYILLELGHTNYFMGIAYIIQMGDVGNIKIRFANFAVV